MQNNERISVLRKEIINQLTNFTQPQDAQKEKLASLFLDYYMLIWEITPEKYKVYYENSGSKILQENDRPRIFFNEQGNFWAPDLKSIFLSSFSQKNASTSKFLFSVEVIHEIRHFFQDYLFFSSNENFTLKQKNYLRKIEKANTNYIHHSKHWELNTFYHSNFKEIDSVYFSFFEAKQWAKNAINSTDQVLKEKLKNDLKKVVEFEKIHKLKILKSKFAKPVAKLNFSQNSVQNKLLEELRLISFVSKLKNPNKEDLLKISNEKILNRIIELSNQISDSFSIYPSNENAEKAFELFIKKCKTTNSAVITALLSWQNLNIDDDKINLILNNFDNPETLLELVQIPEIPTTTFFWAKAVERFDSKKKEFYSDFPKLFWTKFKSKSFIKSPAFLKSSYSINQEVLRAYKERLQKKCECGWEIETIEETNSENPDDFERN